MKKCRYCGAELEDGAKFCLECMRSLEEKTHIETKAKSRLTPVIIISAILAAAILFSAFMIACTRGFGPAAPETSAPDITVENDTEPRETGTDGSFETAAHTAGTTGRDASDIATLAGPGQTADAIDSATAAQTVTEKAPDTVPASTSAPVTEKVTRPVMTEPASTSAPAIEPATTKAPGTEAPQTTEADTDAPVSTDTEAVTDDPGDGFVRSMYTIQTADQIRELMIYEMQRYRNDPKCFSPRLSAEPVFKNKTDGWYGYNYDYPEGEWSMISGGDPYESIYFFCPGNEKTVIPYDFGYYNWWEPADDPELYTLKNSYRAFGDMFGKLCNALGLCAYDGAYAEATEKMLRMYREFEVSGKVAHTWYQTHDLPGFKAQKYAGDVRAGILGRYGLPDRAVINPLPETFHSEYYYWTLDITEGPRDIRVTLELREWKDESGGGYYDACILIEYAD